MIMRLLILTILALMSLNAVSQIDYTKRIEFEIDNGYCQEKIIDFGDAGFVLSTKKDESIQGQTEWNFELYNTNLELVKEEKLLLDNKLVRQEIHSNENQLHALFITKKGEYALVTIEVPSLTITRTEGVLPKKIRIAEMTALQDYTFIKASIKGAPYLVSINWKSGKQKHIPVQTDNVKPKNTQLIGFQTLPQSNELFVYVKAITDKRSSSFYVFRLNTDGEKDMQIELSKDMSKNIVSATASKLSEQKYIFTGTYSTKSTSASEGMFFCQIDQKRLSFINYYNFLDLENFLNYLPERKKEKIEKKKDRKEDRGKDYAINYRIAPHKIIQLDDGYIMLGEAYYTTYRTQTYTTTSMVNGVATTQVHTMQVFDGYQYTHAVLARFDLEGIMVWDQVFELWSAYKPFSVKKFISIAEQNQNSLKLAFASRNRIYSKEIDYAGVVVNDSESDEIQTGYEGDESKKSFTNISYWYDNYFLAFGTQKIKNKDKDDDVKRKRKVYFVSKIEYK